MISDPSSCWEWQAAVDADGYGVLVHKGVHWRAHRAAWALTFGPLPPEVHLLHSCDNPRCVRPTPGHLRPGTPADNAADRLARHRDALLARQRREAAGQLVLPLLQVTPDRTT
jgi:HNH endonuclease